MTSLKRNPRIGPRSSEEGWMLTEGIGSILFYLIMIGLGAGILYLLFSSSKVTQMEQGLSTMTMQIQGLYAGSSSYEGLNNAVAVQSGAAPGKLVSGTTIKTPWGGNITVGTGSDSGTFTVKLEGIAKADCSKLAVYQLNMWESVDINGTVVDGDTAVADAVGACSGKSNTIIYTSR
jgi:hypothetical protein